MPLEEAKSLSKMLQKTRHISAVIYISITRAKEAKLSWNHHKALVAKILKVEYFNDEGNILSASNLANN